MSLIVSVAVLLLVLDTRRKMLHLLKQRDKQQGA
ncbi:hypothetical protein H4687_003333 [Streptomyces stelliscabiei]|uniref:Uncharacterized protein n=1 Tax=Streptomyces stelliscabiei TaxID=146820 RepID=A0A8I0P4S3_9ACTN|nr:hypothetical protein [Streptomyces stelliscabiei]